MNYFKNWGKNVGFRQIPGFCYASSGLLAIYGVRFSLANKSIKRTVETLQCNVSTLTTQKEV
jgi:hypothetical protein